MVEGEGSSMLRFSVSVSLFSLLVSLVAVFAVPEPALTAESAQSLDTKIASILPTREEDRWLNVPWRTNLTQARLEAQTLNRPMFLWIMNGHPMGCT